MENAKLDRMDRRAWLGSIARLAGAALGLVGLGAYLAPSDAEGATTVDLGPVDAVVPDGGRRVTSVAGTPILLSRQGANVTALDLTCTHAGCPLSFDDKAGRIRCACHGGAFSMSGQPVAGPPRTALRSFECKVVDARLYVHVPERRDA